jgi:hypothetical protein
MRISRAEHVNADTQFVLRVKLSIYVYGVIDTCTC